MHFYPWSKSLLPLTFSIDILAVSSYHLGGLCHFDERAVYESRVSTGEWGMLPSFFFSAQMHDFTSASWLTPWQREQFLSVMYSVSTEVLYSSPGHVGICQLFADEIHLFLFQRENQSHCKDPAVSERMSSGRKSSYLKLNLGKTEVALSNIPIFSRKPFSFLLVQKPSLWEFSHPTTNFKGQNIGILTESQNSS